MKKIELERILTEKKLRQDVYELNGGLPNECYCLNQAGLIWEVYYSERGQKTGLRIFTNEDDACDYLYSLLKEEFGL